MIKLNKTCAALGLIAACSIGCGGDDGKASIADSNDSENNTTNTATNADPNNTTANPNNTTPNPNNTTANPNNTTANPNNTTNTNNVDPPPTGTVIFGGSADLMWYASSTLTVQIAAGDGTEEIELVLDDDTVLHTFGADTEFEWDTTSVAEGEHTLKLRYTVGGNGEWSDDVRTVVIDRAAPELASATPEPNMDAASDTPVTLTFDEVLDPATVSAATIKLEFTNGQSAPYTTSVSADGLTINVDFDRSGLALPYSTMVTVDGVTDLAGNSASDGFTYAVPAWLETTLAQSMSDLQYFVVGGIPHLVGVVAGTPDEVRVYKKERGNVWQEAAAKPMGQVYDIDADVADDKIHVAVLRQTSGGVILKAANILTFDPADDSMVGSGSKGVGLDSNGGAIALDMRELPNETRGALAVVSAESLAVFTFGDAGLQGSTVNSFPSGNYNYVRDEDLSVHVRADSLPDVTFARCSGNATPCYRTLYKNMRFEAAGGGSWTEYDFDVITPISGNNATCDEYTNFQTLYNQDILTMFAAYDGPCIAPQPELFAVTQTPAGAEDVTTADIIGSMPSPDTVSYSAHIALGATNGLHTLLASRTRLLVAQVGPTSVNWYADAAADLDTNAILLLKRIRNPRLYMDGDKPVVVFRHGGNVHVRHAN